MDPAVAVLGPWLDFTLGAALLLFVLSIAFMMNNVQ